MGCLISIKRTAPHHTMKYFHHLTPLVKTIVHIRLHAYALNHNENVSCSNKSQWAILCSNSELKFKRIQSHFEWKDSKHIIQIAMYLLPLYNINLIFILLGWNVLVIKILKIYKHIFKRLDKTRTGQELHVDFKKCKQRKFCIQKPTPKHG